VKGGNWKSVESLAQQGRAVDTAPALDEEDPLEHPSPDAPWRQAMPHGKIVHHPNVTVSAREIARVNRDRTRGLG
jgi:hypothetical protein